MKNKLFITGFMLCFLVAFISNLSAQEYKTFDLSKYYTPDIVRNQLDLSGSSYGYFKSTLNSSKYNSINGNLSATFTNYLSTRKMIRTINAGLGLGGNGESSNDLTTEINTKSGNFNNTANLGTSYQLFNASRQFLSFGGNINYGYSSFFSDQTDSLKRTDTYKSNRLSAKLDLYIGAGIGRIETVTDAQQTIYLIEAFTKNNILDRDLSSKEIFSLSQEISRTKNKRFLDARLRLMDEVTHVDSFFVANNLIKKSDAKYFTTLYDIWLYGDKFERKAGQSIEFRFAPTVTTDNFYNKNTYEISTNTVSETKNNHLNTNYILSLIYSYEKPFDQKWQHSINALLAGTLSNFDYTEKYLSPVNNEYRSTSSSKYAEANASYKLGFYPNTRTNIYAQIIQQVGYSFDYSSTYDGNTYVNNARILSFSTNLNLGTYYYFSPQLRLSANLNLSNNHRLYYNYSYPVFNEFNNSFSVGANYSFF
jgi:hypothetical protein